MNKAFTPAMVLLNRVRYPVKFGLILAVMVVPLLVFSSLLVGEIGKRLQSLDNEHNGLTYIQAVRGSLEGVQQHRSAAHAVLRGNESARGQMAAAAAAIDTALARLKGVDKTLGAALRTEGAVIDIESQWQAIKGTTSATSHNAHAQLIGALTDLIARVADSSELSLDPELDTYYLQDVLVNRLPALINTIGLIGAIGSGSAEGLSAEDKARLTIDREMVQHLDKSIDKAVRVAAQANPNLSQVFGQDLRAVHGAVSGVTGALDQVLAGSGTGDLTTVTTAAAADGYRLQDAMLPYLDGMFRERIGQQTSRQWSIIAGAAGALVAVAYLFTALYLSLHESIVRVGICAAKLAKGNLGTQLVIDTRDELSAIADSFNAMSDNFQTLIRGVAASATQLATSAEELSAVARDSAQNAGRQRSETDQVATAVHQMSATSREVARSTSSAADSAHRAEDESVHGKRVVEQTAQSIIELADEIERAATVIQGVERDSTTIGAVLAVIKTVADQTNLLALNAAIEAARAGEHGRGFAVVADEVRTLASRTQQSTQEIEAMIAKLQGGAQNAVQVMTQSRTRAQEGAQQARTAAEAIDAITAAVTTINEMNIQVASAAEEQTAVSEEIARNITVISQISEATASGAEQTTAASSELARLAGDLQQQMSHFKLGNSRG